MTDGPKKLPPTPPLPGSRISSDRVYRAPERQTETGKSPSETRTNTYGLNYESEPVKASEDETETTDLNKEELTYYGVPISSVPEPVPEPTSTIIPNPTPNTAPIRDTAHTRDFYSEEIPATPTGQTTFPASIAEPITGYKSEYSRTVSSSASAESGFKLGMKGVYLMLTILALTTLFSWVPPAGFDWFLAIISFPVGVSLAILSFVNDRRVGAGIFTLFLAFSVPPIPVFMFFIGIYISLTN